MTKANPEELFLMANYYAVPGKAGLTLDQLELAVSKGWSNHVWTKIHPDHENLALEPRFQALMARVLR